MENPTSVQDVIVGVSAPILNSMLRAINVANGNDIAEEDRDPSQELARLSEDKRNELMSVAVNAAPQCIEAYMSGMELIIKTKNETKEKN